MNAKKELMEALRMQTSKTEAYDTTAEVVRIEGGTAWVHIPGGVDETPVSMTVDAKEGDTVQVRVGGGSAWLVGNATAPPTDDTVANEAKNAADNLTVRVGAAESSIVQNAEEIELKVSKDGVINSINVSTEGVTIDAAKLNVADIFAQNVTATGTITGATIVGASGNFTKDFGVNFSKDTDIGRDYYIVRAQDGVFRFSVTYCEVEEGSDEEGILGSSSVVIQEDGVVISEEDSIGETTSEISLSGGNVSASGNIAAVDYMEIGSVSVYDYEAYLRLFTGANQNNRDVALRIYQSNAGIYDNESGAWILQSDNSQNVRIPHPLTVLGQAMVYQAGDTVSLTGGIFAGHLSYSRGRVDFFVPLPKPCVSGLTATLSGNFSIRHADGGYILNGGTLASVGTVTAEMTDTGVHIYVTLTTASSLTNNAPVVVTGYANAKVTFS